MNNDYFGTFFGDNKAIVAGEVAEKPSLSHEVYGEQFFKTSLSVERKSGVIDSVPLIFSERLIWPGDLHVGDRLCAKGQFRTSWSDGEPGRRHLSLFLFVMEAEPAADWDENEVSLHGFVCKEPVLRTTPQGRDIADITIAVNRRCGKSDYIPAIAWGRNAHYAATLMVGAEIEVGGRIQSREYKKKYSEDWIEDRVAYELSINSIAIVAEPERD